MVIIVTWDQILQMICFDILSFDLCFDILCFDVFVIYCKVEHFIVHFVLLDHSFVQWDSKIDHFIMML